MGSCSKSRVWVGFGLQSLGFCRVVYDDTLMVIEKSNQELEQKLNHVEVKKKIIQSFDNKVDPFLKLFRNKRFMLDQIV